MQDYFQCALVGEAIIFLCRKPPSGPPNLPEYAFGFHLGPDDTFPHLLKRGNEYTRTRRTEQLLRLPEGEVISCKCTQVVNTAQLAYVKNNTKQMSFKIRNRYRVNAKIEWVRPLERGLRKPDGFEAVAYIAGIRIVDEHKRGNSVRYRIFYVAGKDERYVVAAISNNTIRPKKLRSYEGGSR